MPPLYSAIRTEALFTSQIEATQATWTDLFGAEAGFAVSNTDDVEEVTNYLRERPASYRRFEMLPMMPRFTIEKVRKSLDTSFPTAHADIVREMTGQKLNRN